MVVISELLVSAWAKEPDMGTVSEASASLLQPNAATPSSPAVVAPAPSKGPPAKAAGLKKAPLLPPGFDFVRLPNGELKLVPQQGLQAQKRRESNAASKLIVSASKEARRLIRDVRREQSGTKSVTPSPLLQNTTTSTRIAALRALEALGSINLNPVVRQKEGPVQLGDIGDPWGLHAQAGGQSVASSDQDAPLLGPQPEPAAPQKVGEPLQKKPRFQAPGATVFKVPPPVSKPPTPRSKELSLPANMVWIPSEENLPKVKPTSNRRRSASSSVWRLYGILPTQVPPMRVAPQAPLAPPPPPPAKRQRTGEANVPILLEEVRLSVASDAIPPVPQPAALYPATPQVDLHPSAALEVPAVSSEVSTEDSQQANGTSPLLDAPAPVLDLLGTLSVEEPSVSLEPDLPAVDHQAPAVSPPLEAPQAEDELLGPETGGIDALEAPESLPEVPPKPTSEQPPRDPTVPQEGIYNFAFVADPALPGIAVELPPGVLRKEGTLRDRAAALKYPLRARDAAPVASVRRLAVDVSTVPDHDFNARVAAVTKQAVEQPTPLNKMVAWAAQQLHLRGAVMMTSATDHYHDFLGSETSEEQRDSLPPAHLMDLIQGRLCPFVAASSFSRKHGYMLHCKLSVHYLYEAMAELRSVERRRNRLIGFPSYIPPKARASKRGPKASGTSAEEIVEVVGTEELEPGSQAEPDLGGKDKQVEEAKQPEPVSPKKARTRPASKKTGWL